MQPLEQFLKTSKQLVDEQLLAEVDARAITPTLKKAMRYSLEAGGKRIRPILLFATLISLRTELEKGEKTAAALEMIHTYSLIHDDLPAMDNDDYRRGKLTNHKVFGDATAILAGDGLLTLAFSLLSEEEALPAESRVKLIQLFAEHAGPEGMVAGQQADIEAEDRSVTLEELAAIHRKKTGALLKSAVLAGAIIANTDAETYDKLNIYADNIGVAFQIADDILDVVGDEQKLGKKIGMDAIMHKSTYPGLLTLVGAQEALNDHVSRAKEAVSGLSLTSNYLVELADLIAGRDH